MEILLLHKTVDDDLKIGLKICYKDINGNYSRLGIITDTIDKSGYIRYLIDTSFGAYAADELKLIKEPEIYKIDHNIVEIVSVERLEKGIVRTMVKIKGILFKRIHDRFSKEVSWTDEELTFNDCLAMTSQQEKDLEGIFKAYIILLDNGNNL